MTYDVLNLTENMRTDSKRLFKEVFKKSKEDALKAAEESEMQGNREKADYFRRVAKLTDYYITQLEASLKREEIIEMLKKC